MKLTRLRLVGFKSFVEAHDIHIEPGLTGIVGPNGCGKSNILESIRWVGGEASSKTMRGSAMDDVIFAGTASRPARLWSEVTITFDNQEHQAPSAFNAHDTLEITRRIDIGEGSRYQINGADVLARDVRLLFADTALHARSTSFVGQGEISRVITTSPTQRRVIFEEAAGVSGLYARRHEAELRLNATQNNLTRLEDVMEHKRARLKELKKQARKAQRYQNLSGYLRETEALLAHHQWCSITDILEKEKDNHTQYQKKVESLTQQQAEIFRKVGEIQDALTSLRQKEAEDAAAFHRVRLALENCDKQAEQLQEQVEKTHEDIVQQDHAIKREETLQADSKAMQEKLHHRHQEIWKARDAQKHLESESNALMQQKKQELESREARHGELTQAMATHKAQMDSTQELYRHAEERHKQALQDHSRLTKDASNFENEHPQTLFDQAQSHHAQVTKSLAAEEKKLDELNKTMEAHREATLKAQDLFNKAERTVQLLEVEQETMAGLTVETSATTKAEYETVFDKVIPHEDYTIALNAALGDDLLVARNQTAPRHWKKLSFPSSYPSLPEGVTPLSKHILQAPEELTGRLSQIGVVHDEKEGTQLQARLAPGQRLVSPKGDLWRWDGYSASSQAFHATPSRVKVKTRLQKLEKDKHSRQKELTQAKDALEKAMKKKQLLEQENLQSQQAVRDLREKEAIARQTISSAQENTIKHQAQVKDLTMAIHTTVEKQKDAEKTMATLRTQIATLQKTLPSHSAIEDARHHATVARTAMAEVQARHHSLMQEKERQEQALHTIKTDQEAWQKRSAMALESLQNFTKRQEYLHKEMETLKRKPEDIEVQRKKLLTQVGHMEKSHNESADNLARKEQSLRETSQQHKSMQEALTQARENLARCETLWSTTKQRATEEKERIQRLLNCEPQNILKTINMEISDKNPLPLQDDLIARLARLEKERENLGGVNLQSQEDAKTQQQELEDTEKECSELLQATERLREAIREINRESRQRLKKAFEEVSDNFQKLFTRLFSGGKAEIRMVDSDDPLTAGYELFAHPPGKKLRKIALLSGGEQTLTSLALILSVLIVRKSPLCMLDEVDAPLDNTNTTRFCNLMEDLKAQTQGSFLIVTHNPITMARMDRLLGVTMQERGVSTLLTVNLAQAVASSKN